MLDVTGGKTIFAALYAVSNVPPPLVFVDGAISDRFNPQQKTLFRDIFFAGN
jgi:hypothetical protein